MTDRNFINGEATRLAHQYENCHTREDFRSADRELRPGFSKDERK